MNYTSLKNVYHLFAGSSDSSGSESGSSYSSSSSSSSRGGKGNVRREKAVVPDRKGVSGMKKG